MRKFIPRLFQRTRSIVIEEVPNPRSNSSESTVSVRGDVERNGCNVNRFRLNIYCVHSKEPSHSLLNTH